MFEALMNFSANQNITGLKDQIDIHGMPLEIYRAETESFNPLYLTLKIYKTEPVIA